MQKYLKICKSVFYVWFIGFFLLNSHYGMCQYSVAGIPNPKEYGQEHFVIDLTGSLSAETITELNRISQKIDKVSQVEYVIVFVDDYQGDSEFDFAFSLFNRWGIGKKESNNGLLLFLAKNRHEWRFITGSGIEPILTDAYLKLIGEMHLVPNFQSENYDLGLLETSRIIQKVVTSSDAKAELQALFPEPKPFWSFENEHFTNSLSVLLLSVCGYFWIDVFAKKYRGKKFRKQKNSRFITLSGCLLFFVISFISSIFLLAFSENIAKILPTILVIIAVLVLSVKFYTSYNQLQNSYKDEANKTEALQKFLTATSVILVFLPLAYFGVFALLKRFHNSKNRFLPPDDSGNWERIDRDQTSVTKFLDKGQIAEEKINSVKYEIWQHKITKQIVRKAWVINSKISDCPNCGYKTYKQNLLKEIQAATYSAEGEAQKYDQCENCQHIVLHEKVIIPKKVRSTTSSSGSAGSSRSSSSSSGSFGGGSSSGGGAGGRW